MGNLGQLALVELEDALKRERMRPDAIAPRDRPYNVEFWLEKCVKEYGLGGHPYVQKLYQERFGRPVPQEYLPSSEYPAKPT